MANYQLLKADIDAKVYQNGLQEITGENLNSVLNAMVTTLGAEYQFAGVATTATNPGTTDAKVFYIANGKGTYTNFGGIEVTEDEVVVLYWDTAWHKEATGIASQAKLSELESEVSQLGKEVALTNVYLEQHSIISNKYPSSSGQLVTLVSPTSFANVLKVPASKKVYVQWEASNANTNFGILFSNDSTFDVVESFIAPYTKEAGRTIINVPNNISYMCIRNSGLDIVRAVDGYESTTIIEDAINKAIENYNSYTPLGKHSAIQGYLNDTGQLTQTSSSSFGSILYNVVPGQIVYIKQEILPSSYGFYLFIDTDDIANAKSIGFVSTNDGNIKRIVVPYGAKYLVINTGNNYAYAQSVNIPESVSMLGYPVFNSEVIVPVSVNNYNPGYHYTNIGGRKSIILHGESVTGQIFSSIGVYDYTRFVLNGNTSILYIPQNKFGSALKENKKIRISFDVACSINKKIDFRLYHYNFQYFSYSVQLTANEVKHVDYTFPEITDISLASDISLFAIANSGELYIANLIVTDNINEGKQIVTKFNSNWTNKTIDLPYAYKQCIYIGDSISTANNYKWKEFIEDTYTISYVRDTGSGLNPANGGRRVIPEVADESALSNDKKSIWYRCAEARMRNFKFDIISLFGGTNDKNAGTPLGTLNDIPFVDDVNSFDNPDNYTDIWTDTLTFAQCYKGCIEMLKRDFPDKEIVLVTVYPTQGDNPSDAEAMAVLQCRIGNMYNLRVVPLFWNMMSYDALSAYTLDGVHPNIVGARQIAIQFANVLGF